MLRQLPLPPGTDPSARVISVSALLHAAKTAQAEAHAAELAHVASQQAAEMKAQAQRQGYADGFAHALHALAPVMADLLAERARWVESVRSTVVAQLSAELLRLDFSQAQIERWCAVQQEQGAQQMAVYLPQHQSELEQALLSRLPDDIRIERADVPAPVVTADDLVFVLEPASNLQVTAATEQLAMDIQSLADYQAGRFLRLATRPGAMAAPGTQEH